MNHQWGNQSASSATSPYNKMDPMSRVNFLKIYTVEHNVKVEDFGHVDPKDEWKFITQFNAHWGITTSDALPPATRSKYYDGNTFGPAPGAGPPSYSASNPTAPSPAVFNTNMPAINEDTAHGHHAQQSTSYSHPKPRNDYYYPKNRVDDRYEQEPRPPYHRRSSSHKSDRDRTRDSYSRSERY